MEKLIKITDDHYVVVDDSEIKEGNWFYNPATKEVLYASKDMLSWNSDTSQEHKGWKKITHSTQPLECDKLWTPVNDKQWLCNTMLCCGKILNPKTKPISLQEVKELIGEVDVEKKAREEVERYMISTSSVDLKAKIQRFQGYMKGYNQALEDNKEKKYTEEQLIWAIQEAYGHGQDDEFDGVNKIEENIKAITKHLQPKTEWEVEMIDGKLKLL